MPVAYHLNEAEPEDRIHFVERFGLQRHCFGRSTYKRNENIYCRMMTVSAVPERLAACAEGMTDGTTDLSSTALE